MADVRLGKSAGKVEEEKKVRLGKPAAVTESTPMDMARQYFYGFNESLYNMSGWSLVDSYVSDTGLTEKGEVGDWVKRNIFQVGDAKPKNKTERVLRSSGNGTAFGAFSAMGVGVTAQLTSKAPMAAKTSEKVMSSIVDAFRSNPASFAAIEAAATAGSEGAVQAVKEEGGGPVAQTAAALVGGVAPVALATGAPAMAGAATKYSPLSILYRAAVGKPQPWTRGNAEKVAYNALKTSDPDAIKNTKDLFERIGVDKDPSLAEASGSPQLLAKQRYFEQEAKGTELDWLVERKKGLGAAVRDRAEAIGPEGDNTLLPGAVRRDLDRSRTQFDDELEALSIVKENTGLAIPKGERLDIGNVLRNRRNALRNEVGKEFSEVADEIGINGSESGIVADDFVSAVKDRFFNPKNKFANQEKPAILKTIKSLKPDDDGEIVEFTFDDVKALRQRLSDDISDTINDKKAVARELIEAKKMLDDWFQSADPPPGVNPDDWAQFRTDYQEQYIARFERGVAHKIGRKTKQGDYQVTDEKIADTFLQNEATVGDYYRLYADKDGNLDPTAKAAMEGAILDKANAYAVADGMINERKLGTWVNNNRRVLQSFPDTAAKLSGTRQRVAALSKREAVLQKRKKSIELTKLKSLSRLAGDYDQMIDAALGDPRSMRTLIRASERSGVDKSAVKSAVWERYINSMGDDAMPSHEGIHRFMKKNQESLEALYSKQDLKKLDDIYEASVIINRTPLPIGAPQASGAIGRAEQYLGTGVAQASSRMFAVQSGRTGKFYPFIDGAIRFFDRMTKRQADALMKQALFDPRVADDLHAIMMQKSIPKPIERRLNAYMFEMGFGELETKMQAMFAKHDAAVAAKEDEE